MKSDTWLIMTLFFIVVWVVVSSLQISVLTKEIKNLKIAVDILEKKVLK